MVVSLPKVLKKMTESTVKWTVGLHFLVLVFQIELYVSRIPWNVVSPSIILSYFTLSIVQPSKKHLYRTLVFCTFVHSSLKPRVVWIIFVSNRETKNVLSEFYIKKS